MSFPSPRAPAVTAIEVVMFGMKAVLVFPTAVVWRLTVIILVVAAANSISGVEVQAQQPQPPLDARVVVTGEGSVNVAPDHAQITGGVSTKAKTVKEATDANSKLMSAITSALLQSAVAQKDIQTSRFSVQPIYAPGEPRTEPKLTGYNVSNQVRVTISDISKAGDILDRLVAAGATNVGNIVFLVSDPSKALDEARKAAVADARRKAEMYAQASGLRLGRVLWITEDTGLERPMIMRAPSAQFARSTPVPIESGEETLRAKITVGFDIDR